MFNHANKVDKVSDNIIAQIRDAILSGKLKPGDRLASERELTGRFRVSKATMREALRVLEVMGLIEIRKGIAGGAFVAEVDMKTTIHSLINFLHFQSVTVRDLTMLRYLVEPPVAQIAAAKLTERDSLNLKRLIEEKVPSNEKEAAKEIGFHRYLARMAENMILVLLVDFIENLLSSLKSKLDLRPDFYQSVREAHELILECLIQRDSEAAGIAMADDVLSVGRLLSRLTDTSPFEPSELGFNSMHTGFQIGINPLARVVREGHQILQRKGSSIRRVGAGPLYVVANKG